MRITTEEVLAALRDFKATVGAEDRPPGAFTLAEACEVLGVCNKTVLAMLHKAQDSGRLELVRFRIVRMDGRGMTTTGYRITSGKVKAVR